METRKGFYIQVEFVKPESCPKDLFLCANNKCLDPSILCDGNDDCGDNSDESTICFGMLYSPHIILIHKNMFVNKVC